MAKRGRPIKDDAMTDRCIIRLSGDELDRLEQICDVTGKNKSDVIRKALRLYSTALED